MRRSLYLIFFIFLVFAGNAISAETTFNFIRVLKPDPRYPNLPEGWDPRVAIAGEVVADPSYSHDPPPLDPNLLYNADPTTQSLIWNSRLNYFHWPKNDGEYSKIEVFYDHEIPDYIINTQDFSNAIANSFGAWENIPTAAIDFDFKGSIITSKTPWEVDNDNVVSFCYNSEIFGFEENEVVAKTLLTWDSGDRDYDGITTELIDCDIVLNASEFQGGGHYTWSLNSMDQATKTLDIQSVLTHEIGHLLGIAHPFSAYSMPDPSTIPLATCPTLYNSIYPAFTTNLNMRTLEDYDKNCATYLYPFTTDGNDSYTHPTPVGAGTYNYVITQKDYDWYVTFLERYDSIKVVIEFPNKDLDVYLCYQSAAPFFNPNPFDNSTPNTTHNITVVDSSSAHFKSKGDSSNFSSYYEYAYAHTVTQPGNYYILVKGKYSDSAANYTMKVYISKDGDGSETLNLNGTSRDRKLPIPDGDGIQDWWEMAYGFNPANLADAQLDFDIDGLTNLQEFQNLTDPKSIDTDSDGLPDKWEVDAGLDPNHNNANEDPDNDGLSNLVEYNHATLPNSADTDIDSMPDGWEIQYGLNPTANDAGEDPDNDGLTNLEEYNHGTNPMLSDTDNDLIPDLWEISNNLNPTVNDASTDNDNDGKTNLEEYYSHTNPQDNQSVFKLNNISIDSGESGLGNGPSIVIHWQSQPNVYYEILYMDLPENQFKLMEEFLPGNMFQTGIQADTYYDRGYPFPSDQNPCSIRKSPFESDKRLYKIRIKQ